MLDDFISEWQSQTPTVELHTSGSTGQPKTIIAEKRRMEASARTTCAFLGLRKGDRALLCMSTDFIAGKMMIVRALVAGLDLVCVPPSGHPLAQVGDTPIDFAAMVPLQVYNSLQVPAERERLEAIRHLIIGGGAVDETVTEELAAFPNAVWSTYGMTETLSHIALRRLNGADASEWYTPLPGVVVNLDHEGRIVIEAPEIVADAVVTNDIGEMHADGHRFRIRGRIDNVICSGGIKLQIEEIERLLKPHLSGEFIVSKRPDPKFGEIAVLLHTGNSDEARRVCTAVLPKYMQPRAYVAVETIPLTPTGKPARAQAHHIASQEQSTKN